MTILSTPQSKLKRWGVYASIALVASLGTLLAVRARAAGIPDADVLTYTGYLEGADGQPLTAELSGISLEVWDAAESGERVCDTSVENVTPQAGRFQLVLPTECVDAVKATPNLWVDVKVEGASLGRTKLGAVPYAIEAAHATAADVASTAGGELAKQLAALEAKLGPSSGFRALKASAQQVPHQSAQVVLFDQEAFDLSAEFNPATGKFTAKADGYYDFRCQITFSSITSGRAIAHLDLNGGDIAATSTFVSAGESGRVAVATLQLAKGDTMACSAYQDSGSNAALRTDYPYFNVFTGTRISGL